MSWLKNQLEVVKSERRFKATTQAWWEVFTNTLYAAIDDMEDLHRMRDPEMAKNAARGARNLADAAIAAYEDRFAL